MARVTHVRKAQQRYETVTVLDDEGNPKRTPVMRKDGTQKTTKRGKPVFMTVTVVDKSKPKPNLKCDFRGCDIDGGEILPGTPYNHISPRSGPYGGRQLSRHAQHPVWFVWEYSSSMSARLAQISHDFWNDIDSAESPDDVQTALDDASSAIEELAGEKREGAENIENGFGHPTSQSEELEQMADDLESWASDVSSADIPELPDPDTEVECDYCGGTGKLEETVEGNEDTDPDEECSQCNGEGTVEAEEITEDQLNEWRDEVRDALTIIDESPV